MTMMMMTMEKRNLEKDYDRAIDVDHDLAMKYILILKTKEASTENFIPSDVMVHITESL